MQYAIRKKSTVLIFGNFQQTNCISRHKVMKLLQATIQQQQNKTKTKTKRERERERERERDQ